MGGVLLVNSYGSVQAPSFPNMVPGYRQKRRHAKRIGFGVCFGRLHDDSSIEVLLKTCGVVCCWSILVGPYRHHQVLNTSLGEATGKVIKCMRAGLALGQASAGSMTTVARYFMTWLVGWCAVGPLIWVRTGIIKSST